MSEEIYEQLKKQIDEIHRCLVGDYENQGLVSRLKKLEDRSNGINKALAVVATALVGLIVNTLRTFIGV